MFSRYFGHDKHKLAYRVQCFIVLTKDCAHGGKIEGSLVSSCFEQGPCNVYEGVDGNTGLLIDFFI